MMQPETSKSVNGKTPNVTIIAYLAVAGPKAASRRPVSEEFAIPAWPR